MSSTKFILMKKCLVCHHITQKEMFKCTQCGSVFTSEASPKERMESYRRFHELNGENSG